MKRAAVLTLLLGTLAASVSAEEQSAPTLVTLPSTTLSGCVDTSLIWSPSQSAMPDAVPEPSSVLLLGGGLLGLLRRRVLARKAR